MGQQTAQTDVRRQTTTAMVCRLRHRTGRGGRSSTAGEVEIENVSEHAIEIEVTMHPLQYLNLVITDLAGNLIPAAPYGNIFSPREVPSIFRLAPGERYTHNVSLLGTIPEERQLPGNYTVFAVYEYNGLRAVSEPLSVQVLAKRHEP